GVGVGGGGGRRAGGRRITGRGVRVLARAFSRRASAQGLAQTDAFAGFDEAGRLDEPRLGKTIAALGRLRAGSAELCVHPGVADDPARLRYQWGYQWSDELRALCAPAAREAVRRAGLELGTYGDLRKRARPVIPAPIHVMTSSRGELARVRCC